MSGHSRFTRRQFVKVGAAATAAFTIVPSHVLGGPNHVAPSDTIIMGIIGCGGQGQVNTRQLLQQQDVKIIAIADPRLEADYSNFYYKRPSGRGPVKKLIEGHYGKSDNGYKCKDYIDFREMLDKEKDIDAILCATPDHWHAFVTMTAIRHGKHVYCEKPLTHNIYEARMIDKAAREAKVATQMGNQGRSSASHANACEMIWNGALGAVKEAHAWSGAGSWIKHRGRPTEKQPIPDGLDWELWLGPKEDRPYSIEYCPYTWRGWWEFGTGAVGDMMIHNIDPVFASLDLAQRYPVSVECLKTDFVDTEVVSPNNHIVWQYAAETGKPPLTIHWYDGTERPQITGVEGFKKPGGNGVLIIGDKGAMSGGGWSRGLRIIPEEKNRTYLLENKGKKLPRTMPRATGHHRDWLEAVKGGRPALSNFEYGAKLTEFVLLANVAIRAKKKITWDGPNMKVTNDPSVQRFVQENYRRGFDLAKV